MFAFSQSVEEKCIVCSFKYLHILTKWTGFLCFQIDCNNLHTTKTVHLSKTDLSIAIFLCILLLYGASDSIMSLVYNNYGGNGTFFRVLFIIVIDINMCLCEIVFLVQTNIAKLVVIGLIDILNDSTLFRINISWSKRQFKTYEYKTFLLCLILILLVTIIILLVRLSSNDPHISYVKEISLYVICYYYLSYSIATFMLVDLYCLLIKAFEKYVQVLVYDISRNKQVVSNMCNVAKLQNISRLYLKIYFCFQQFICYYSPNVIIFMVGLSFAFLLLILSISFYALEGKIDIIGIVLALMAIPYGIWLFLKAETIMRKVSFLNFICVTTISTKNVK